MIAEGIGLTLLKIVFKTIGVVISGGLNSFKGNLSSNQYILSKFVGTVFHNKAHGIIVQSYHHTKKFVNR